MQWVLIDRVGHLAFYFLTKISGSNRSSNVKQSVKHFSTIKTLDVTVDSAPAAINGWTADGWREDEAAAAHTIATNGKVTMSDDKTIYAVYRRNATFYSGSNKAKSVNATQYYSTTNKYSLLAASAANAQAISGWTAKTWLTSGGAAVAFGARYTDTANVFYCKYERNATFYHGVNKAKNTAATQVYTSDNKYSLTTPALNKATALGNGWAVQDWWQKDDNKHFGGSASYTGSRNVFYAYYKRTITIAYSANGGTGTTPSTTGTQYYDSSNTISPAGLKLAANKFSRTGYVFSKWNLGAVGGTVNFAVGDAASKTASAQWAGFTYKVTYRQGTATGGWSTSTYADQSGTYPNSITLRTNNMTKNNTEKSGSRFTVTFNANGGSVSPGSAATYIPIAYTKNGWTTTSGSTTRNYTNGQKYSRTDKNGTTLTLYPCFSQTNQARTSIKMPTPSRTNMTCTGWWSATSGGTKLFLCGVSYSNVAKSQTVYAQWTNATANMGAGSEWYATSIGWHSHGSENYYGTYKCRFRVKFQLLAGKTWKNMVDDDNYKWPVYYEYKRGINYYLKNEWTDEGKYTTRAALKTAATDGKIRQTYLTQAYLYADQLAGWTKSVGKIASGAEFDWTPKYAPPTSADVVFFRPFGKAYPGHENGGDMCNLGCFATATTTVGYNHMSSSGYSYDVIMPTNPLVASSTINLADITGNKLYIFSDTGSTPVTDDRNYKIVQFK